MKLLFPSLIFFVFIAAFNSLVRDELIDNHCNDLTVKEYEGAYFPIIGALFIYFKMVIQGRI